MNEEVLTLDETTLARYMHGVISNYEAKKKEIETIVLNMPQKHSYVNHIANELEAAISKEKVLEDEIQILKSSCSSYFLLTNAILYLERRWNTNTVKKILQASLSPDRYNTILHLVIDQNDGEVQKDCSIEPIVLSLPEDFSEMERISSALSNLYKKKIIFSIRDAFTAYKTLQAYSSIPSIAADEILNLIAIESINFKEIIGGVVLFLFQQESNSIYCTNLLLKMHSKNKGILSSFVQLLITIYNTKDFMWEKVQSVVPYLYLNLVKERDMLYPLVYTLSFKNAVFLFEIMDGCIHQMEIFDECFKGRHSVPSDPIREAVQELLNIPQDETYSTPTLLSVPEKPKSFSLFTSKTPVTEILDRFSEFCFFFVDAARPSFTHFNNMLIEYKSFFRALSSTQIDLFVFLLLSSPNSLTYKELSVNLLFITLNGA